MYYNTQHRTHTTGCQRRPNNTKTTYLWQLKLQSGVTSVGAGTEHLETNLFQVGLCIHVGKNNVSVRNRFPLHKVHVCFFYTCGPMVCCYCKCSNGVNIQSPMFQYVFKTKARYSLPPWFYMFTQTLSITKKGTFQKQMVSWLSSA